MVGLAKKHNNVMKETFDTLIKKHQKIKKDAEKGKYTPHIIAHNCTYFLLYLFMYEYIGYLAISVGSISLLPQIYHMIKTKKVADINIYFLFVSLVADILYILYGTLDNNIMLTISTLPPTVATSIVTFLWFYYQNYPS